MSPDDTDTLEALVAKHVFGWSPEATDRCIAEIRAAEQAATPGPWKFLPDLEDEDTGELVAHIGHPSHGNYVYIGLDMCVSDADFCILARTAVPELLAEVERLQAQLELAREVANDLEWALSWLEQKACGKRRTLSEAKERLKAFREVTNEP